MLAVTLLALSIFLGYQVTRNYLAVLELTVAAAIVGAFLRWPRQTVLLAIPATLLPIDLIGGWTQPLIIAALTTGWIVELLGRRWRLHPAQHGLLAAFGAWLVLAYVVDGVHLDRRLSAEHDLATLLAGLSLCAIAISIRPHRGHLLAVGSLAAASLSILSLLTSVGAAEGRLAAVGLNPNYVGAALSLGAVASLAAWVHNKRNPFWIATGVACLVGIHASGSRGAIVMLLAGAAVLALLGRRRLVQVTAVVVATAVFAIPGLSDEALLLAIGPRTASDFAFSDLDRTNAGMTALRYAVENPAFGVGYGQFAALAERDPLLAVYVATHNDYLRLAAESGLPAALLLVALIGLAIRIGEPLKHRSEMAMVVAYAVGLLFGNYLSSLAVSTPFWLWLGLSLHLSARRSAEKKEMALAPLNPGQGTALPPLSLPAS